MLHSVLYYSFVGLVLALALRALMPPRRRRPYRLYGRPTPAAKPGQVTSLRYGTTADRDDPDPAGATKAASPSPRPPGTPGNAQYPPPPASTTLTTLPRISNGGSHSTVWITSADGAASSTGAYGDYIGSAA